MVEVVLIEVHSWRQKFRAGGNCRGAIGRLRQAVEDHAPRERANGVCRCGIFNACVTVATLVGRDHLTPGVLIVKWSSRCVMIERLAVQHELLFSEGRR
ncbi:MAG: hypothetical protein ACHQAQ_09875 [Hyphomicrobiales bacterium]